MNRLFLSYRFNSDRDRDLAAKVEAVLESFDIRAVTGEVLGGEELTPAVQATIEGCDGLIALATARPPALADGTFHTHPWVVHELLHARSKKKRTIALVEKGVTLGGMLQAAERIDFDPTDPLPGFVKLVRTVGRWKREAGRILKVQILPPELSKRVGARSGVVCEYRFLDRRGDPSPWHNANITREPGGAFAYLRVVNDDELVEIRISINERESWFSIAAPQWMPVTLDRQG